MNIKIHHILIDFPSASRLWLNEPCCLATTSMPKNAKFLETETVL